MNEEESLEEQLKNLVAETRQHPQPSVERQRGLNKLIRIMQRSGKIWRDSSPDYEDALQATWEYFCKNLSAYDPQKASVITWFNNYLKWRLLDQRIDGQQKIKTFVNPVRPDGSNIIDEILSPENHPDSEEDLWDFVCKWIKKDSVGKFKGTHVGDRPDVNAQVVCLGRLHGKSFKELATELSSTIPTLNCFFQGRRIKGTFIEGRCIKLLKEIPVIKQAYESREAE